jgi:hypothetical protein
MPKVHARALPSFENCIYQDRDLGGAGIIEI